MLIVLYFLNPFCMAKECNNRLEIMSSMFVDTLFCFFISMLVGGVLFLHIK